MSIESYLIIATAGVLSILIAFAVTPLAIRLARRLGIVDIPADGRRMHDHPIPLLGGLSIIAGFCVAGIGVSLYIWYANGNTTPLHYLRQLLPGALIVAVMGMLDDKFDLPALPRLLLQCLAAGITVAMGVRITFVSGSFTLLHQKFIGLGFLSVPITVLWIVGMTNAVNWIDGLDGLAAGVSAIASCSIMLIAMFQPGKPQLSMAVLAAALAGGCLGLLPYNKHPARIFMGDAGAMFLGFTLAVVSIQGYTKIYATVSFLVPLLILGLPLLDTSSAIIRRVLSGKSPTTADRSHIHHKLVDMGLSQRQAVTLLYCASAALSIVGILYSIYYEAVGWKFLISGLIVVLVIFFVMLAVFRRWNGHVALKAAACADKQNGCVEKAEKSLKSRTVVPISLGFANAFLIKGKKSILVDTGIHGSSEKILAAMECNGVKPEDVSLLLITHAHSDHYGSLAALKNYVSAPVAVHESEAGYLLSGTSAPVEVHGAFLRLLHLFFKSPALARVTPDIMIGEKFDLTPYGVEGAVIHTPGHTEGSVSVVLRSGEAIVGDMFGGRPDGTLARLPDIYTDLGSLKKSISGILAGNPERIYTSHGGVYSPQTAAKLIAK